MKNQKILVTVGSTSFDQLVKAMDNIAKKHGLKNIKAQIGKGKYKPKNMEWFTYDPNIRKHYQWADLIVSIDSAGTIFENLELGKKIIAVTPPNVLGVPDLPKKLALQGYLIHIHTRDPQKLEQQLENTIKNPPKTKKYKKPECTIHHEIKKLLG